MGELSFFLGLQIKQGNEGILINQNKYTKELVKKFRMENAKSISTLMSTTKLDEDESDKRVDQKLYCNIISSLLYLTANNLKNMSSVRLYARFQSSPKLLNLLAVKHIIDISRAHLI